MTSLSPEPDVLISAFAESLHGRKIRLLDRPGFGDALPAYAQAHRRLFRQFEMTMRAVLNMEAEREVENWESSRGSAPQAAADAFQDLVYRATELFDFYIADLPKFISQADARVGMVRDYRAAIKSVRDDWALLCNKCKHNHCFLVPVEAKLSDGDVVCGYSIYGRNGDCLSVEPEYSGEIDARSYNWAFRKLIAGICLCDENAGKFVRSLADDPGASPIVAASYSLPYAGLLRRIFSRPQSGMPREIKTPSAIVEGLEFLIGEMDVNVREERGAVMRLWMDVFGHYLAFKAPYTSHVMKSQLEPEDGSHRPTGRFIRIDIANLKVSPLT